MMRKRPKSLDAPVVGQLIRLEMWAYKRCDQWKRSYRYTLVAEFRQHITAAKNEAITAFELAARLRRVGGSVMGRVLVASPEYAKFSLRTCYTNKYYYKAAYRAAKRAYKAA